MVVLATIDSSPHWPPQSFEENMVVAILEFILGQRRDFAFHLTGTRKSNRVQIKRDPSFYLFIVKYEEASLQTEGVRNDLFFKGAYFK